jgi:formylmethanofuran dehydrogenase subunit E
MLRLLTSCCVGVLAAAYLSEDHDTRLPTPHYQKQTADPEWLSYAAQFHGHLGPMLTFGVRMGMSALQAVGAEGYFDVEVTCDGPFAKPPASCFLDGIQIATGATLGKRNLRCVDGKDILVRIKNTRTGNTATLRPKADLLALLSQPKTEKSKDATDQLRRPNDHSLETLSRKIATMPEMEILTVASP